jgi:ribosome-binding protein aMBF1 (putative translation factor)
MAKKTDCDICGDVAITEIKVSGTTLTETKLDVCEPCFAKFKEIWRAFTKQDVAEVVIDNGEVIVK